MNRAWVVGVLTLLTVACVADPPPPEPTATACEPQCIPPVCGCAEGLIQVSITPAYLGDHITYAASGTAMGEAGDPYWLGICSDGSPWCATGTWTWTTTTQAGAAQGALDVLDCPASYGYLWGYNQAPARNLPQNAQCGIDLATVGCGGYGSQQQCMNGKCCIWSEGVLVCPNVERKLMVMGRSFRRLGPF